LIEREMHRPVNNIGRIALTFAILFVFGLNPARSDTRAGQALGVAKEFPEDLVKYQVHPWEMLKFSEFRAPYRRAVGPTTLRWMSRLDGPANLNTTVQLAEGTFVLMDVCKPNACDSDRALILFRPQPATLWGLIYEGTSQRYLGNPPGSVRRFLKQRAAAS
jgi:inhibitor of lysozyme (Ivy)